jgi:hypothetical protein
MSGPLPMPPLALDPGATHLLASGDSLGHRPAVVAGKYAVGGVIGSVRHTIDYWGLIML